MMILRVAAATDVGRIRSHNEDRCVVGPWILGPTAPGVAFNVCPPDRQWVGIFDGMGGHAGGGLAATAAAEVMASFSEIQTTKDVQSLTQAANVAIYKRMSSDPQLQGMGSTLVGAALIEDHLTVFNVGDSRAYRIVDGYMMQVTRDDASSGGFLTASLGGRASFEEVSANVIDMPLERPMRYLLATDGLFGHVELEQLELQLCADPLTCVQGLMSVALDAGGPDNVTLALVELVEHQG